jgi:hypothetical protein
MTKQSTSWGPSHPIKCSALRAGAKDAASSSGKRSVWRYSASVNDMAVFKKQRPARRLPASRLMAVGRY